MGSNTVPIDRTTPFPRGNEDPIPDVTIGNEAKTPNTKDAKNDLCANDTEDAVKPNKCDVEAIEHVVYHFLR